MLLPKRHDNTPAYRYGFQGQEMDDEVKGEPGTSLNYTFRMHDPRVGRFFATDPLTPKYPHYSPYSFSGNKVIAFRELEGLEEENATVAKEIESKDTRTYKQTREGAYKVDTYVDCSEFVHEVVTETMGVNVGTYTEDIKKFYETNTQAIFETDFSGVKLGDAIMWVDKRKTDRTITHIGIVSGVSKSIVTVTHASSSKNSIASNIKLSRKKDGSLGKNLAFVGLGRIDLLPEFSLENSKEYYDKYFELFNRKIEKSIQKMKVSSFEALVKDKESLAKSIIAFTNKILENSGSDISIPNNNPELMSSPDTEDALKDLYPDLHKDEN